MRSVAARKERKDAPRRAARGNAIWRHAYTAFGALIRRCPARPFDKPMLHARDAFARGVLICYYERGVGKSCGALKMRVTPHRRWRKRRRRVKEAALQAAAALLTRNTNPVQPVHRPLAHAHNAAGVHATNMLIHAQAGCSYRSP